MQGAEENALVFELRTEFGMPSVKIQAVRELLRELEDRLSEKRPEKKAVYWAVASHEPAGKLLEALCSSAGAADARG